MVVVASDEVAIAFDKAKEPMVLKAAVLTLASPVFDRMLSQEMQEKKRRKIELKGKDPEEFKTLLSFLIPGKSRSPQVTTENVDFLLQWSDEYSIDELRMECMEFIRKEPASMKRIQQIFTVLHIEGVEEILRSSIDRLLMDGVYD